MADQPQNSNYIYGAVTAALTGKTAAQKHFLKSSTLLQLAQSRLPYTFVRRNITVTITQVNIVNGDVLTFVVSATRSGKSLHVDNPLLYVNPPIMAPNGSTYTDASGHEQNVMSEQPLVALQEMITQTIEAFNLNP